MWYWRRFCVALSILLAGCGEDDNRKMVFPVQGRLTFNGQPMKKALISFHPLEDSDPEPLRPTAEADQDGKYRLTAYITNDGAPAGKYAVTIYWPAPVKNPADENSDSWPADLLRGAYSNQATSRLRATVQERENVIDFSLP